MGTYSVDISKHEMTTIYVEAEDAPTAESIALEDAKSNWDSDVRDFQVDDVTELTSEAAAGVSAFVIGGEN